MTTTDEKLAPKTALQGARWEAGLSLEEAVFQARKADPDIKTTMKTVSRYETGEEVPEEKWNPRIVLALCNVYGADIRQVSPIAAGKLARLNAILNDVPDLQKAASACRSKKAA